MTNFGYIKDTFNNFVESITPSSVKPKVEVEPEPEPEPNKDSILNVETEVTNPNENSKQEATDDQLADNKDSSLQRKTNRKKNI